MHCSLGVSASHIPAPNTALYLVLWGWHSAPPILAQHPAGWKAPSPSPPPPLAGPGPSPPPPAGPGPSPPPQAGGKTLSPRDWRRGRPWGWMTGPPPWGWRRGPRHPWDWMTKRPSPSPCRQDLHHMPPGWPWAGKGRGSGKGLGRGAGPASGNPAGAQRAALRLGPGPWLWPGLWPGPGRGLGLGPRPDWFRSYAAGCWGPGGQVGSRGPALREMTAVHSVHTQDREQQKEAEKQATINVKTSVRSRSAHADPQNSADLERVELGLPDQIYWSASVPSPKA